MCKVSESEKVPTADVRKEATQILDELGHSLGIKKVRFVAYFLIKVFKALFNRIYVNDEGIQMVGKEVTFSQFNTTNIVMKIYLQLRKLVHEYPILLMPTHRSYMDFLLLSYVCYDCDLPLPVIAAAMGMCPVHSTIHRILTIEYILF